jgi:sugar/nucleoside kinase (ribokinase family)
MTVTDLDLLVVGDANLDVILSGADLLPDFGQVEKVVDNGSLVLGGSASIAAAGAARLGLHVGLCAVVGDDAGGDFARQALADAKVGLGHLRLAAGRATGITVVLNRGDDRAMLTSVGTISELSPGDLERLPDRPAGHVHIASYFLMSSAFRDALPEHLARFRRSGVTVSLDPNWDPQQVWDLRSVLSEVDVVLPNRVELAAITDRSGLFDALRVMTGWGPGVVVKCGAEGAHALIGSQEVSVAGWSPPRVIDTVGAGDSFDAGFLVAQLLGMTLEESVRMAVAAGALSTTRPGGTNGQPTLSEARSLVPLLDKGASHSVRDAT